MEVMDFNDELIEYEKLKTELDEENLLTVVTMFINMRFPLIKELEVKYDKKRIIWVKFKNDNVHTKEMVEEEIEKLKKEITHYASHR